MSCSVKSVTNGDGTTANLTFLNQCRISHVNGAPKACMITLRSSSTSPKRHRCLGQRYA